MTEANADASPSEGVAHFASPVKSPETAEESREAYFKALRVWVNHMQIAQNAAANFPYYLMANYPQLLAPASALLLPPFAGAAGMSGSASAAANAAGGGIGGGAFPMRMNGLMRNPLRQQELMDNPARNAEIIGANGGYEYVIAPLWKRMVAEILDIIILFVLKLMVAFMIIDIFEIDFGLDFEALRNSMDDDYIEFLALSSEMLYVEVVTKFFVCVYEALWTRSGIEQPGGATPGKICMGLRVLYVEAVVPLPPLNPQAAADANAGAVGGGFATLQQLRQAPLRALVYPAQNMGFQRAMVRALAKNVLMTLMFPLCFIMLFYRNNRTSYDVATRTIVVETAGATPPVLRRM